MAMAPRDATAGRRSSRRTVATTEAPAAAASWTAAVPTPPAAPCTHTRSPMVSWAWVNRASWAVVNTSGNPPASSQSSSSGTGRAWRSCTTASWAWPAPPTTAMTRSPAENRRAPGPASTTSPASSNPGMSWGMPGGAG